MSYFHSPFLMYLLLIGSICAVVSSYLLSSFLRNKLPPLPPGPPADFIIGHIRFIPSHHQETLFYQWGKIYGDVMYLYILGKPIIVLNSVQAAVDLLEKRSANYSDRPRFVILEMMGWVNALSLMKYGKKFHKHRKMLQDYLHSKRCISYRPIQAREARVLLRNILSDEERRDDFLSRFCTAIVMRVGAGHQINSDHDPYIAIARESSHAISNAGSPGSTPVDYFPFLQYLPSWFPGTHYASLHENNKPLLPPFMNILTKRSVGKWRRGKQNLLSSLTTWEIWITIARSVLMLFWISKEPWPKFMLQDRKRHVRPCPFSSSPCLLILWCKQ